MIGICSPPKYQERQRRSRCKPVSPGLARELLATARRAAPRVRTVFQSVTLQKHGSPSWRKNGLVGNCLFFLHLNTNGIQEADGSIPFSSTIFFRSEQFPNSLLPAGRHASSSSKSMLAVCGIARDKLGPAISPAGDEGGHRGDCSLILDPGIHNGCQGQRHSHGGWLHAILRHCNPARSECARDGDVSATQIRVRGHRLAPRRLRP